MGIVPQIDIIVSATAEVIASHFVAALSDTNMVTMVPSG